MIERYINVFDSTSLEEGEIVRVKIPIKENYGGDYRLEYDSKYITLFGKDKNYKGFKFEEEQDDWYEEMILVSLVAECRNARPIIEEVNDEFIIVRLN